MARERSPDRDRAMNMWLESGGAMKLKDIAAALSIGESKVRKWKSLDRWEEVLKGSAPSDLKGSAPLRGAPKGNKNAKGNNGGAPSGNANAKGNSGGTGGPPGNKKAVTTGEYETIWLDTLEDDEQDLLDLVATDPLQQADEALLLLTLRERRMLMRIKALVNGLGEKERSVLYELKTVKGAAPLHDEKSGVTYNVPFKRDELVESRIEEKEFRKIDDIIALEEALTRVQDKKLKAIELKNRIIDEEKKVRIEKLKLEVKGLRGPEDQELPDDGFLEALKGNVSEVWADGDEA